jgi:hypothetical protein
MKRLAPVFCLMLASCTSAPLLHQQDIGKVHAGMTSVEVEQAVGVRSYRRAAYANGTASWTYKYRDTNIAKLLHVTYGADGRVMRIDTEWDPDVYSKKSGR